uniref:Doublesex- and mab-3-related transcription factor C1/C2 C-terminal domain-containing protein n=1 Tax=Oryctolagus cuniculus TaxID=9986 RepID=G1TQG5_RABIT
MPAPGSSPFRSPPLLCPRPVFLPPAAQCTVLTQWILFWHVTSPLLLSLLLPSSKPSFCSPSWSLQQAPARLLLAAQTRLKCSDRREHQKAFPAVTTSTREQGAQQKKHPALGLNKSMTIAPGVPVYINNMAMGAGIHTGKVNIIPQPQAYPCYISNQGALSGVLLFSQSSEPTFLPCTPVTTEPQLVFTISGQPQGPPILPATSSSFIVQSCATLDPLLQPQVPKASEQALVVASEWERRLEAAEALLALRDSIPTPPDPRPLAQPCGLPAGKVNIIPQPQAYPCYISNQETPPEGLLFIQPPEPTFLPCTPVTTGPQLVFAISGQPQRPLLPGTCSNLILQPCATVDTLQLQPQVPKASEQALVAASEWQQKLEAAKALLALRNSRPTSTDNLP